MATRYRHDPNAVLDYSWDWTAWLAAGESITSHTVVVPAELTLDSSAADTGHVTAWISGGVNRGDYEVTCRITTDQGRTDDRSIMLLVLDR